MEVGRWGAIGLLSITVWGVTAAETRDHLAELGLETQIAQEAGPSGGTIVYPNDAYGYLRLDSRVPVEVRQERHARCRGAAIT